MDIVCTCPLGHICEKIVDQHIERCMWYNKLIGIDGEGKEIENWGCAIVQMPFLQIETAMSNRGQTAAIESLRNETVTRQDKALERIGNVRNIEV